MKRIALIDTTLREGEQTPGVRFSQRDRLIIIQYLHAVGVDEIELGISARTNTHLPDLLADSRSLVDARCCLALWCRCREDDILFAAECRPDVLSLSIPASDLHIHERLGKSRDWIIRRLEHAITLARKLKIPQVAVGFEDATRADPLFLVRLVQLAENYGAFRVRLADTVGICAPADLAELVRTVRTGRTIDIGVHCHNDFGMASANGIAALDAGARWLDATVLGLGERAGNSRLEEVVGFLSLSRGCSRYHPAQLARLCSFVAGVAGLDIGESHPVVGRNIFTCETGLHQHGLLVNPETYEPYNPTLVGRKRCLRFGGKSGRRALSLQLRRLGIHLTNTQQHALSQVIRKLNHPLTEEEFVSLATALSS